VPKIRRREAPSTFDPARCARPERRTRAIEPGPQRASVLLTVVMVSPRAVEPAAPHAAFPETCVPNRRGTDRCGPASPRAPYRRAPRGKPRFTFVSEGKPLRRLLLTSNRNSSCMTFLLRNGLPVTSRKVRSEFIVQPGAGCPPSARCWQMGERGISTSRFVNRYDTTGAPSWLRLLFGRKKGGNARSQPAAFVSGHGLSRAKKQSRRRRFHVRSRAMRPPREAHSRDRTRRPS
jgi:hypothetical protein